jgi:hypothetical protein
MRTCPDIPSQFGRASGLRTRVGGQISYSCVPTTASFEMAWNRSHFQVWECAEPVSKGPFLMLFSLML